ncbi:unnamed protein product [Vitrella brassicaformis CCMP3155]|uniref:Uncharacterized protein n=1 Tax=Vitrella brassicaformis (strain CCMP3155) TaxID=1169540 RepID=A0A0G4GV74_VITBC|nr:unnamed protein product [Vitrella brassicaformis CCMP3155]|eukprot:CEM34742.1 unnamed protein product [Vitrella brassicaformis CCMP3155]
MGERTVLPALWSPSLQKLAVGKFPLPAAWLDIAERETNEERAERAARRTAEVSRPAAEEGRLMERIYALPRSPHEEPICPAVLARGDLGEQGVTVMMRPKR